MPNSDKSASKFLSFILRHNPAHIGLTLDAHGWAYVAELLARCAAHQVPLTPDDLKRIVAQNDKQRFVFSDDGSRIRANQGHSIQVDLQLQEAVPPAILFHGTALKNIDSIQLKGILKGVRQQVHLSTDEETARKVGARYGKPVIITVNAERMSGQGHKFYRSENGVWLTDWVPPEFLTIR